MKNYEIERKYLIREAPDLSSCSYHEIEQAYLCTEPVVRVRRQDEEYYLTYKAKGNMIREEYNLPLTKEAYLHLREKADGRLISKRRYLIPFGEYTIELDEFFEPVPGLRLAEVEFPSEETANAFTAPDWFGEEVTNSPEYHNSNLSKL
ncbi:MAG: CYTH domain-containing protein [Lachnospiraceae bacterium]|nr:CYTH domain-containing protein [Lachnospiraceae bacterium]